MHPENTIPAVEAVAPHGDAVEIDVRQCGSGELVVRHDAIVDRWGEGPYSHRLSVDGLSGGSSPTL